MSAMFTRSELEHIKAALIIMRDIDASNIQHDGDSYDQDATLSAELILKIEHQQYRSQLAAAPDLLAALQEFCDDCECTANGDDPSSVHWFYGAARAAIAKAEENHNGKNI